jgi:diguanylate cyclase (GGDEF)-like protein
MSFIFQALLGIFLAAGVLGLGTLPGPYVFFISLPIFFTAYLASFFPILNRWFLIFFIVGLGIGRLTLGYYGPSWVIPEIIALWALSWVPVFLKDNRKKAEESFGAQYGKKKEQFDLSRETAEKLKKINLQTEKQLRQIEHLYDVIKEAGGTLNVQEMIELIKDFTERMFDLSHVIMAVLSNDGKKYEVRVASGCDESIFRSFEIDLESDGLAGVLSREKKPIFVPSAAQNARFSGLKNLAIQSFVFLPLLAQDRVIGFLCAYSPEPNFIDQEKFSNFQVFCNQVSIGLQKSILYEKVQMLSITDGLTRLFSHRYFKQRLEEEIVLANRYSSQLSLLILDIDHFKKYNDSFGHVAGDHVLREVAKILKGQSDKTHLAARYGGEEMVLIAPETTKESAMELAEKIRKAIESNSFVLGKEVTNVTVSIGVATFPQDSQMSLDLISKADKALYAAKARGRNRIVAYPI